MPAKRVSESYANHITLKPIINIYDIHAEWQIASAIIYLEEKGVIHVSQVPNSSFSCISK